jgi:Ca2+-transporting ATPase
VKENNNQTITGLTPQEVENQRSLNGANVGVEKENILKKILFSVVTEPMFILLMVACTIYFVLGELAEAFTMLFALAFVAGIDVFQNFKSQRAVKALNKITSSKAKVIRSGETLEVSSKEIVTQDILICEEGTIIPADAEVISSYDFSVNEAIITGESVSLEKQIGDTIIQGTLVVGGYCNARVSAVGKGTILSGIGKLVNEAGHTQSPLQEKVAFFVKRMVIFGGIAFLFVWSYHTWESGSLLTGLLHGLAMAMSVLPEELPVALSTFMALGAYRLLKIGIIAKSPRTVETLGSATVICVDKTGTLTKNLMKVTHIYDFSNKHEINYEIEGEVSEVLEYAMWASEEAPFDPMEKSIHEKFGLYTKNDQRTNFKIIKEFPLSGKPPVMTHIFGNEGGDRIFACKGALEGVVRLCNLNVTEAEEALALGKAYAQKGLRVLGVAKGIWDQDAFPEKQEDINFKFLGLITFFDPPDEHIFEVIKKFYQTGVRVVMITGDYPETAVAIANITGIKTNKIVTGDEVQSMNDIQLKEASATTHIFARISPEQKLKIIEAFKSNGEIVAMTGDGVNDAAALKAAHIGVSMGKRGTEVAKEAAGLILSNDNIGKMIDAIFLGRRINENLKKAFRYIISIHIPIILLVTLPIFLVWLPSMLFTPIHVIFLELIMGPTCSIIYENEPLDEKYLLKPSDSSNKNLLKNSELWLTILQGLIITIGCLVAGYLAKTDGGSETYIRAHIFSTLIFSNIFLTLANRSFKVNILKTIQIKNNLIPIIIGISVVLLLLINFIPFLNTIFLITPLTPKEFLMPLAIAVVSTLWIEVFKNDRRIVANKA